MNCPSCGRENAGDVSFCGGCGAGLAGQSRRTDAAHTPYPAAPPRTSGLAIASVFLGVLGFLCFPIIGPVIGLVLGLMAISQISRSGGTVSGSGIAIAGTIVSGIGVLLVPIMAAILFPVFAQAREKARQTSCMSNEKQLALGVLMYTADFDERMPVKQTWADDLSPYVRNEDAHGCPSAPPSMERSYGYNARLDRLALEKVPFPAGAVMLFDAKATGSNPTGGPELLAARHQGKASVAFVDGHVQLMAEADARSNRVIRWDPTQGPSKW